MRSLAIVLILTATAAADPPCLDYTHARINGKDGKLVVCMGDALKCSVFADAKSAPTAADWPGNPSSTNGTFGRVDNKLAVCLGTTCKKVGDKLTKAALRAKAEITTDLAVVVLDGTAWSVAADAELKIAPPSKQYDTPVVHAAGASLVAEWRNCADTLNCDGIASIADTTGKVIGGTFPGGDVILLDAHHAAVIGYGHTLTTFDTDTHKQLGHVAVTAKVAMQELAVGKIDDNTVGIAWAAASAMDWKLAVVTTPAGKAPSIAWTRSVPICPP